jgi:hypothetical protein
MFLEEFREKRVQGIKFLVVQADILIRPHGRG